MVQQRTAQASFFKGLLPSGSFPDPQPGEGPVGCFAGWVVSDAIKPTKRFLKGGLRLVWLMLFSMP